jgi:hypothetical protein
MPVCTEQATIRPPRFFLCVPPLLPPMEMVLPSARRAENAAHQTDQPDQTDPINRSTRENTGNVRCEDFYEIFDMSCRLAL